MVKRKYYVYHKSLAFGNNQTIIEDTIVFNTRKSAFDFAKKWIKKIKYGWIDIHYNKKIIKRFKSA